jgi:hypothetical protein
MKTMAFNTPDSTMYWMQHDIKSRISAFFKDRDTWENIPPGWEGIRRPSFGEYQRLDHGYIPSLPRPGIRTTMYQKQTSILKTAIWMR